MNVRSPAVLFVAILALTMAAATLVLLAPAFFKAGTLLLGVIPIAITVAGIVNCITSGKPTNTVLLWIVIMILAPLLGPLLWFAWGKQNT